MLENYQEVFKQTTLFNNWATQKDLEKLLKEWFVQVWWYWCDIVDFISQFFQSYKFYRHIFVDFWMYNSFDSIWHEWYIIIKDSNSDNFKTIELYRWKEWRKFENILDFLMFVENLSVLRY